MRTLERHFLLSKNGAAACGAGCGQRRNEQGEEGETVRNEDREGSRFNTHLFLSSLLAFCEEF